MPVFPLAISLFVILIMSHQLGSQLTLDKKIELAVVSLIGSQIIFYAIYLPAGYEIILWFERHDLPQLFFMPVLPIINAIVCFKIARRYFH